MLKKILTILSVGLSVNLAGCGGGGASGDASGGGTISSDQDTISLSSRFESDRVITSVVWSQTGGGSLVPDSDTVCEYDGESTTVYCPVEYKTPQNIVSPQTYSFKATAMFSNGDATSKTTSVTVVPNQNSPLFASAGSNVTVFSGNDFTLNASGSSGGVLDSSGGSTLVYTWNLISTGGTTLPGTLSGEEVTITAPNVPEATQAVYQLTVTDVSGYSATDTVMVSIVPNSQFIVVNAGNYQDITLFNDEPVRLNFSGSTQWQGDDGGVIYARWVQEAGNNVTISNSSSPSSAYANISQPGVYIFSLVADSKPIESPVETANYPTNQVSTVAITVEAVEGSLVAVATYDQTDAGNDEYRVAFYGQAYWENSDQVPSVYAVWKLLDVPDGVLSEDVIVQNRTSLTGAYAYLSSLVYGHYTFALYVSTDYIDPNASIIELNSLPASQQYRLDVNVTEPEPAPQLGKENLNLAYLARPLGLS